MTDAKIDGYTVIQLTGNHHYRLRDAMYQYLPYGFHAYNSEHSTENHVRLTKALYGLPQWRDLIYANREAVHGVLGGDILYQREPYLRIARPGVVEDQIGIHRDTHYGASPHEWVLWFPLTDAVGGAELRILPGSHLQPDDAYPWTATPISGVEKGSDKQWLGFRYSLKKMSDEVENATVPVPCKLGQAILFNSACVHGQKVNNASWTRFSVDVRFVSASDNANQNRGLHGALYEPFVLEAA